ncbi:MAG: hypothetical protein GY789_25495 [Hyphomicrobiales bacterium]|nr:hypothetical protein [Hyphomicrobiales bacterium]MCP4999915.1 hypothetical protein [Hyphomicrobiales bacterium]
MGAFWDILRFRRMIAPYLLEILFWGGIGGTLYGAYWLFIHNHWAWWIALIFGSILTRVIFEFGLLAFRSYERLVEIRDSLPSPSET